MEMLLVNERRAQRRTVFVDCQVVREEGFQLVGQRALDLSPKGLFLRTDAKALPGEELLVTLRIPGTARWVDAMARVARVVRGRRRFDMARGLGLSFALESDDDRRVREALLRFPPILPAREARIDYAATASLVALS